MMKHLLFGILCGLALCGCHSQTSFGDRAADAATLATGNPVEETIRARRSIRRYEPQPVGRDTLLRILDCGLQAPNGQGRESWEVRVVTDSALLAALDRQYGCYVRQVSRNPKAQHPAAYGAPALVFIACDTTYDLSQVDCGLLGGNMILAAQSVGVGSCCLGGLCRFLNAPEGAELLRRLQLPDTHRLLYAIAFGYPAEMPAAKPRNREKVRFVE